MIIINDANDTKDLIQDLIIQLNVSCNPSENMCDRFSISNTLV